MIKNKIFQHFISFGFTLIGFLLSCVAYYPGFLSPDSLDQYQQGLTHQYSDWHPPIMAGFWSLLMHIQKGGVLMFLLQITAYWISFYILIRTAFQYFPKLFYLIPILFYAPYMINFIGNVWKDVGLAISWLLAIVIMIRAHYDKRRLNIPESIFCLILLCYGCWIRINALPGVMPLLGMWIYSIRKDVFTLPPIKPLILKILGLTFLVLSLQIGITKLILKPKKTYPEYKLFLHDLTGIYKETGQLYFPKFITEYQGFDSLYIKEKYIYASFDNIWWNNDNKHIMPDANSEQMQELQNCWMHAILQQPKAYFKNRIKGFLQFLRINQSGSVLAITYFYIHPNNFGLTFTSNKLTQILYSYVENQRTMPYMQPWFWLLINLILLFAAHHNKLSGIKHMLLFLAYSSLFYIALEFIVYQADTEFRYFYWNCISLSLALILLIKELSNKKENQLIN